jgi:hypothetical protein
MRNLHVALGNFGQFYPVRQVIEYYNKLSELGDDLVANNGFYVLQSQDSLKVRRNISLEHICLNHRP